MNSSKNKKKLWRFFFQTFGHFLRNEQRKCRWKSTTIDWVCPKKSPDNAIWYRKPYEETFNLWNSTLHDRCERACLWNTSPFQVFTLQGYKWKGTGQEKLFWNFCNGYSMFFPFFFILIKSERFQNIFFSKYMYICFNPIQASCTTGLLLFSDHLWPSLDAFFKKPFLLDKVRNLESAKVEPYCLPYALDGILPLNSSNNQ